MCFLFINKTLRLNNLKTRTDMNSKISVFVLSFVLKGSYICYYIICMTLPLIYCRISFRIFLHLFFFLKWKKFELEIKELLLEIKHVVKNLQPVTRFRFWLPITKNKNAESGESLVNFPYSSSDLLLIN